jgi:dGTPase
MLGELVEELLRHPELMEPAYRQLHEEAPDDAGAVRVVIDQVASLTDAAAWGLHRQLLGR